MKVSLITLGCAKNLVDSEYLKGGLHLRGVQFIDEPEQADAVIVNTCGFIESAKEESIDTILSAVELKKQRKCRQVFVTGCLSERYGKELKEEIPEVDGFYGNRDLQGIVNGLAQQMRLQHNLLGEAANRSPGRRELLTPSHYAYLKISEGCEHPCTFCAIPGIRGRFRSKPIPLLVEESRQLATRGVKELILVAQDSTQYGLDLDNRRQLPALLRALCEIDGIEWIRLMYAYPHNMTDELIDVMAGESKIVNYLDMPIQHVTDAMLRRMARRVNRSFTEDLIERLHASIPDLVLRTSLIVGFPGETDRDFEELHDFVCSGKVQRLGIFTYSQEDDTPAAGFADQISEEVKRDRYDLLMQAHQQVAAGWNKSQTGRTLRVLIDEEVQNSRTCKGRTAWDCPEIDHTVVIKNCNPALAAGDFCQVTITHSDDFDLYGSVAGERADSESLANLDSRHFLPVLAP